MRKVSLLGFVLIISLLLCLNTCVSAYYSPSIEWESTFGGDYHGNLNDQFRFVQEIDDGNYIAVGIVNTNLSVPDYRSDLDVLLVKFGNDGNVLFEKIIDIPENTYLFANFAEQTKDNGFIIGGSQPYGGLLVKLNSNCNIEWTKTYSIGGFYCGKCTSDNGYIVGGYDFIAKIDENGNIEWSKIGNLGSGYVSDIFIVDDGYVIGGGDGDGNGYITQIDSNGEKVWKAVIDEPYSLVIRDFEKSGDNGWLLAGHTSDGKWVFLSKITSTWSSGWIVTRDFTEYFDHGLNSWNRIQGWGVDTTSDGGYVIVGTAENVKGYIKIYLLKTDSYGHKLWDTTIGTGSNYEIGRSIKQTPDDDFIIVGFRYLNEYEYDYRTVALIYKLNNYE